MATKYLRNVLLAALTTLAACAASNDSNARRDGHSIDSIFISQYDFVNVASDTLYDPTGSLAPFFTALESIKSDAVTVPIIHFGDSHVQGGALTMTIMRRFARDFGTGGRGFVTPHKLTGKNEPRDYSITTSPAISGGMTIIDAESRSSPIGISGVAARIPSQGKISVQFLSQPTDNIDFRFRRIIAFHDSLAPIISVADKNLVDDGGGSDIFSSYLTELNLLNPTDSITLTTEPDGAFANGALHGFSLENGEPGVIYHSLGVNGACYLHWGRQSEVARQTAALLPRLIIISLGSNEASGTNFIESVLINQIDSFVRPLQAANPGVPILLTVPAEAMRRKGRSQTPNTNFEHVRAAMRDYVERNGLALFDLYQTTSAAGSAEKWKEAELLARDGIHYTSDGYTLQGLLLYTAIENEAKKYRNK